METVDSRAISTEEISSQKSVGLPPGLTVLTPEEVQAQTDAIPEEVDEAQAKKMIEEAMAKAEQQQAEIKQALQELGCYMLIRFENPASIRHTIAFSDQRPSDQAMLAVFRQRTRELETYETRRYWLSADAQDKQAIRAQQDAAINQESIKRGLPMNRKTRRDLRREMFGFDEE